MILLVQADGNEAKQKADDYDIIVREMAFEVKAQVSDICRSQTAFKR